METKTFKVDGLSCPHCVAKVQRTLQDFPGMTRVVVSQNEQAVRLEAETIPTLDALNQALSDAGNYRLSE